jgi:hypothetical protein
MLSFGIVFLSGCVSQRETMIEQGYPMSYVDGFEDGCHSGKKAGGMLFEQFKKDVRRFNTDKEYAQGWTDAFRECETEQEAMDRQMRMSMQQQQLLEQKKHDNWQEKHALDGIDTSGLDKLK